MPADSVSRNLLKFLITSVGFPELRLLVAQRIDSWIQNPKVTTSQKYRIHWLVELTQIAVLFSPSWASSVRSY